MLKAWAPVRNPLKKHHYSTMTGFLNVRNVLLFLCEGYQRTYKWDKPWMETGLQVRIEFIWIFKIFWGFHRPLQDFYRFTSLKVTQCFSSPMFIVFLFFCTRFCRCVWVCLHVCVGVCMWTRVCGFDFCSDWNIWLNGYLCLSPSHQIKKECCRRSS